MRTLVNGSRKQQGFVITSEYALIAAILVLGLITGWVTMRDSFNAELFDTANAIESSVTLYYFNDPNRSTDAVFTPQTFNYEAANPEGNGGSGTPAVANPGTAGAN